MDLPGEIRSFSEIVEPINGLLYSEYGVGKTVAAAQLPRVLFIATEVGTKSAEMLGYDKKVWVCLDWKEFVRAYEWIKANCMKADFPFEWIVIDNASKLQYLCFMDILAYELEKNSSGKRDSVDKAEIQDWNVLYNRFRRYTNLMNGLPVHTLWLANMMNGELAGGHEIVLPAIQSSDKKGFTEARAFAAAMHFVGYYELVKDLEVPAGNGKPNRIVPTARRILFQGDPPYTAKDRYNVFKKHEYMTVGEKEVNTFDKLVARIGVDQRKQLTKEKRQEEGA